MNDILHANIFFFITSVAVIAVTLLFVVVLWYVIEILREVRAITKNVHKASDGLESDLAQFRQEVRSSGTKLIGLFNTLVAFAVGRLVRPAKQNGRKHPSEETDESGSV